MFMNAQMLSLGLFAGPNQLQRAGANSDAPTEKLVATQGPKIGSWACPWGMGGTFTILWK